MEDIINKAFGIANDLKFDVEIRTKEANEPQELSFFSISMFLLNTKFKIKKIIIEVD